MRQFVTLLLASGVLFFASCGNGANAPVPVAPVADTVSSGGYLATYFGPDSFFLRDLTINNVPSLSLHATVSFNETDSLWECRVQEIDQKRTTMGLMIMAVGGSPNGVYTVQDNSSTLIDYSHGENKTYSVSPGSQITITQSIYPIKGTMSLQLYYNHTTINAIDSFKIYN